MGRIAVGERWRHALPPWAPLTYLWSQHGEGVDHDTWMGVVHLVPGILHLDERRGWIFQIAGNLTVEDDAQVILSGGAQPENVFWQIAGQATLGTGSDVTGILLSQTQIVLQTGAVFNGRALAQTAVTLDANLVTQP